MKHSTRLVDQDRVCSYPIDRLGHNEWVFGCLGALISYPPPTLSEYAKASGQELYRMIYFRPNNVIYDCIVMKGVSPPPLSQLYVFLFTGRGVLTQQMVRTS